MTQELSSGLMAQLEVQQVTVGYGDDDIVREASLTLKQGEIGCLLGPSGCGKSTLLRAIAGFEPLRQGDILMQGATFSSPGKMVSPEKRNIGMVFQDIALFPHLTIAENICFGIRKWSRKDQQKRVKELLELVGLPGVEARYPHSLSGGQQQRIALARAMAPKPQLLLLDEPFSGLDANLRETLVQDVRAILKQEQMSAILVTHDQMEAFAMADRIAVMQQGKIQQCGNAFSLYHEPANRFVADFIGLGEFIHVTVADESAVNSALGELKGSRPHGFPLGQQIELLVRPDDIKHCEQGRFKAEITSKWFRGSHYLYQVQLTSGEVLPCITSCDHDHDVGEEIGLKPDFGHLVLLPVCDPETEICELQPAEVTETIS